jgi:putative radical SAM enzyme (TIGR03279 family)
MKSQPFLMHARIQTVEPDSPAARHGVHVGDVVSAINQRTDLEDQFDYDFEVMGESTVTLILQRNGQEQAVIVHNPDDVDWGIRFESPVFTPIKTCNNACPFCFIDQQPQGLRPTLYVKDDDWRLSYFCNTYITLTNLTRHDRERMARIRPGPLYVSVHSTVPVVRQQLLVNAKAGNILEELRWLAELDIPFHAQVVVCPGINDGDSLTQTLADLYALHPHCLSVAIVPVGLTTHRETLAELIPVSQSVALGVIQRLSAFQHEMGSETFAFASDEFYVLAKQPLPQYAAYGEFPQLDDGVGTARLLTEEFFALEPRLPQLLDPPQRYLIITGQLGAMVLDPIVKRLNRIAGLFVDLVPVQNRFWGEAVTVAGLITGQDIVSTLGGQDLSGYTAMLLPQTMLKSGGVLFLDGMSMIDLSDRLGCPVRVVAQPERAQSLLGALALDCTNER